MCVCVHVCLHVGTDVNVIRTTQRKVEGPPMYTDGMTPQLFLCELLQLRWPLLFSYPCWFYFVWSVTWRCSGLNPGSVLRCHLKPDPLPCTCSPHPPPTLFFWKEKIPELQI